MKEELFPIVREDGFVIGSDTRSSCHSGTKLLHPVVHLHILNDQNQLLLQKRAASKSIQPSKWDTAVGGHVQLGEKTEEALSRETREELGIEPIQPILAYRYVYESEIERELVYTYLMVYNGTFTPQESEIEEVRFWSFEEITSQLGKGVFTPNFELEFAKLNALTQQETF